MESALYNRDILRLAATLVANDRLERPDGTAKVRSPVCGSRMVVEVAIGHRQIVKALAIRPNACALGQASAAIMRNNAIGVSLSAIKDIRSRLAKALNSKSEMPDIWPELKLLAPAKDYPSRHAAILLPYDALLTAAGRAKESVDVGN